ncbi:15-hydroxyprostaglandin dehydrogenase [NAD(+)]-like [Diaphorina citri]|uniref:15-hydroxyprostaglandin dehydrogenase [NAD(+)] n=1 Tax=Diaphorina citri TaxID=121845 RepID=A0A3Q0IWG9_DIACI|nr:15-hydroxyprostaglandin dehydrogenase [NAD(+)]-like [Diaphorina citri]
MVMDLKGKVALVTGGAAGIGRAYCEELLKFGAKVSICDINDSVGEDLAEQWRTKYGPNRAIYCPCDVTDYPQFEEAFQITLQKLGGLDIVINNAGIFNDRFWELEVDVNLSDVTSTQTSTTPEDMRAALLSDKYEALFKRDFASQNFQSAQSVGQALIHVLQKGTSGSVWAVENNQIPREVKFPANYY